MIGVVYFVFCLNRQSLCTSHNTICADKCGLSLAYLQEMLLLLLPLLNSSSVKKILSPFSKDKSSSSKVDDDTCPICQAIPAIPFLALPCQHRYCYYCLRTRCAAASSFRCPRCGEPVVAMQRHGGLAGNTNPNQ
ncbi:hypothetical protein OIU85_030166 [Salix viminalis]|uniref:RING-type E3 ubiquitin transferase (cysteine targeting) n=1 Tax=Salix viminalis TaxID=40686 RepID=A0A9Q0QCX0_SALVM|nr:hypothetical protein OIU85_030166 [Salix viminalis]